MNQINQENQIALKKQTILKKPKAHNASARKLYISDCHFYHEKLINSLDNRGFSTVEAMNEAMIQAWNGKVRDKDEVYILGDFSVGKAQQTMDILQRLKGKLYLIKGNHDWYLGQGSFDPGRFIWVKPYAEINDHKRKVILCHYPVMCYFGQYQLDERKNPKSFMLYGHVHASQDDRLMLDFIRQTRSTLHTDMHDGTQKPIPCQMINCFCQFSHYEPLTLDEWIELNEKRMVDV